MIIKFREERISDLENKLAALRSNTKTCGDQSGCETCAELRKQLEEAQKEISQWSEVADKTEQAAKLFAEKEELLAAKRALQDELKETPQSLTARIRGLNELTNNLNAYLKEYIMSEGFDRLKEELEQSREELTTKVASLESEMQDKEKSYTEKIRSLGEEHEVQLQELNERLETMKETFKSEKVKIEQIAQDQMTQLKADLDATLAEKGELQKEVFDKVEAHEK